MLEWIDKNGNSWNTIGDQTGSTFNITKVTTIAPTIFTGAEVTVEATFNCKFHGEDLVDSVQTVKNGSLKMTLQNM
jgi:hypothetical protein